MSEKFKYTMKGNGTANMRDQSIEENINSEDELHTKYPVPSALLVSSKGCPMNNNASPRRNSRSFHFEEILIE